MKADKAFYSPDILISVEFLLKIERSFARLEATIDNEPKPCLNVFSWHGHVPYFCALMPDNTIQHVLRDP